MCAGYWDADTMPLHVTYKELLAFHRVLRVWGPQLSNSRVLPVCDNKAVISLIRHGSSLSAQPMAELRVVWQLMLDFGIMLDPVYIKSASNPKTLPFLYKQLACGHGL